MNNQAITEAAFLLAKNDNAPVQQLSHLTEAECKAAVALAMEIQKRQLVESCKRELGEGKRGAKSKSNKNG